MRVDVSSAGGDGVAAGALLDGYTQGGFVTAPARPWKAQFAFDAFYLPAAMVERMGKHSLAALIRMGEGAPVTLVGISAQASCLARKTLEGPAHV